jgi:type IX secretion system PorP/SprF family membrane protein
MRVNLFITLFILSITIVTQAQDAQLSQFYAAPLYLNPAFTGTIQNTRVTFNYRNQWPNAGKPYVTSAASIDHFIAKYRSGVGLMVMQNKAGASKYRSTEVSLTYSYHLDVSEGWRFIPALQATVATRDLNFYSLTFPDQYDNSGLTGAGTSEPSTDNKQTYMDFSAGGLMYSDMFWFGAAYHHLNHPNQARAPIMSRLPGEVNLHGGARIPLSNTRGRTSRKDYKEVALIPAVIYKAQGKFDQLDAGLYLLVEPIMFGVWYRGLPVKKYAKGYNNAESVVAMVGYNYKGLAVGYSYDIVVSSLSLKSSAGAHEISINYLFGKEAKQPKKRGRRLPCPGFYRGR